MQSHTISDIFKEYSGKLDHIDLELLVAHEIGKSREFLLAHPETQVTSQQSSIISKMLKRRLKGEPIAHILSHKEFFGLDFEVNKHTLIPRPETEMLVEEALEVLHGDLRRDLRKVTVVDVGTGSGNIAISIAKNLPAISHKPSAIEFFGIDISKDALKIARRNAKKHETGKKIKFLYGNLLTPFFKNSKFKIQNSKMIILANLPYLSKEIFDSAPIDVKKFEPKSALYSSKKGLAHYEELFSQIKKLLATSYELLVTVFIEFSPEQKKDLQKLIKKILPRSKTSFQKDLAGKWRIAHVEISNS